MEKIEGEYNWCDFFTPCPYHRCVEVGSFDCYECEFNRGIGTTTSNHLKDDDNYVRAVSAL